jgi:cyclic lactone autoinducer peptide
MFRTAIVGLAMAVMMVAAYAAQAPQQFSCSGNMHQPPSPKSGRLIVNPTNKISLDLGQGDLKVSLLSDNKIQLKFSTKEFTGEFFHYTGELFLIYKSGDFAKLTCTPN